MIMFLLPGWIASILLVLAIGPLGSFIICRKMSSFGDTLSHSSLLGLVISTVLNINPFYINLFCVVLLVFIVSWLEEVSCLTLNTILGIIAYSSLSLGLMLMNIVSNNYHVDINSYLFGDLLTVTFFDLIPLLLINVIILTILYWYWNEIILVTISAELAMVEGINVYRTRLIIMLITALTIGISTKFFGALIITALLIIPAATAQRFSNSPEQMIVYSILLGIISVTGGIFLSILLDTETSPSIVIFSTIIFCLSYLKLKFIKYCKYLF